MVKNKLMRTRHTHIFELGFLHPSHQIIYRSHQIIYIYIHMYIYIYMYRRIQQIECYVVIANQQCWHANKTWNLYSSNAGIQGNVRKQPVQNIHTHTQHAYIPLINGLIVQSNMYLPSTHIWLLSASVSQNCAYRYIYTCVLE